MVRFDKGRFVVEIPTGSDPTEAWLETMSELIDLIGSHDPQSADVYYTCQMVKHMLPDWQDAKKMSDNSNETDL